ncbi:MAG: 50S ribosomal protein L9 [Chloroflexi bacterium]|nr:50S ribosomal protein L9 [Chloroflexota bacterium]
MKVILKEYVYQQGVAGDIVDVADGFARNYLIPQGKAIKATPAALKRNEELLKQSEVRRKELTSKLMEVSQQLDGLELVFGRKAGRNNKLYGSVTTMDIAAAIHEQTGIDINRRRISERPLRELGEFTVPIRMGADLSPEVNVIIVPDDELDDFLRRREQGESEDEATAETDTAPAVPEAPVDETPVAAASEVATEEPSPSEEPAPLSSTEATQVNMPTAVMDAGELEEDENNQ